MASGLVAVVLSDLHATSKPPGDPAGSWLTTTTPRTAEEHPIVGLGDYLATTGVRPDLVLCAGDICDKADEAALKMAWSELVALAAAVGARLIATAGNHDLDSRLKHGHDPRGALYDLDPPFPALDNRLRDEYWARNYAIIDGPEAELGDTDVAWRVVSANTSAFHGYTGEDGPELEHGRVSLRTVRRLQKELETRPPAQVSIFLAHHHLEQLPNVDTSERSKIQDGEHLAHMLETDSPWLVIHGHKHRARILYAHGGGSSATIFAAGSASAYPYGQLAGAGVNNQVYILHFAPESTLQNLELGVAAEFESLNWIPDRGWKLSNTGFGLPGRGGFGWRMDVKRLAKSLSQKMASSGQRRAPFETLIDIEPRLRYLPPTEVDALGEALRKLKPPLDLKRDESGRIYEVNQLLDLSSVAANATSND